MSLKNPNRVAGILELTINGLVYLARGEFSHRCSGVNQREAVMGADGRVHGYTEAPLEPMIEGTITDSAGLSTGALAASDGISAALKLGNGKVVTGIDLWYAGDGTVNDSTGEFPVKFVPGVLGSITEEKLPI